MAGRKLTPKVRAEIDTAIEWGITDEERLRLKSLLEAIDPKELEKLEADIRVQLDGIIRELESKETLWEVEYSLENLEIQIDDPRSKEFLKLYKMVIASDLEWLYGDSFTQLSPTWQETVKLVFWNIIQSQIWIQGWVNIMKGKATSFLSWFTEIFGEQWSWETWTILTEHLRSKWDTFSSLKPELKQDIESTIELVESLIGTQAHNLGKLLEMTSPEQKEHIFQNPEIVQTLMETGKYSENGYDIDLNTGTIVLWTDELVEDIQSRYINTLVQETNGIGGNMKKIQEMAEKMDSQLKKLGLDGLDGIKETLFNIPLIGIFFQMIFGNFFNKFDNIERLASVERLLKWMENEDHRTLLTNLEKDFIPKFLEDEDNKETPLWKVFASLSPEFYGKISPFLEKLDTKNIDYTNEDFWENILLGKWENEKQKEMYTQLSSTLWSESLDEEKLISALNNVSVEEIPESTEESEAPVTPSFETATKFPFVFEWETVSYDTTTYKINIWGTNYTMKKVWETEVNSFLLSLAKPEILVTENTLDIIALNPETGERATNSIPKATFSRVLVDLKNNGTAVLEIGEETKTEIEFWKVES